MAWSTPSTRAVGYLVTAATWNQDVVANPIYLKGQVGVVAIEAGMTVAGTVAVNNAGGTDAVIAETGIDRSSAGAETFNVQNSGAGAMTLQVDGSTVWHAGNDGAGSTLDADLLDGVGWKSAVEADASGDLTDLPDVAVSWSDVTGATLSLDRDGVWVVIGIVAFRSNGTQSNELLCRLNFNGAGQTGAMFWTTDAALAQMITLSQAWVVTVAAQPKVAKLQAGTNRVGGSTDDVEADYSKIIAFWVSP